MRIPDPLDAEIKDEWYLVDMDTNIEVQSITENGVSKLQTRYSYSITRTRKVFKVSKFLSLVDLGDQYDELDYYTSPETLVIIAWDDDPGVIMLWACTKDRLQMVDTVLGEVEQTQTFERRTDWTDVVGSDYPPQT
jgi:hypothetical protein